VDPDDRRPDPDPATTPLVRWQWVRLRRHVHWARTEGVARLIEEDQLDPLGRIPLAVRKAWWRRSHDYRPQAVPVFLVGVQRSGTNMLVRGIERSLGFEVRNENDGAAFERFRLRSDEVIRSIVVESKHAFVLFKPLCDSHRVVELLDDLGTPSAGRAIWEYRGFEGRVRSSIAKFGDSNLRALRVIAAGRGEHLWQAGGLSARALEQIRSFAFDHMSPASASALFWYVRNSLYFDLELDRRDDVRLVSYDAMIADPDRTMRGLCAFLGVTYRPEFIGHIRPRTSQDRAAMAVDPKIATLCESLQERLAAATGMGRP